MPKVTLRMKAIRGENKVKICQTRPSPPKKKKKTGIIKISMESQEKTEF